MTMKCTLTGAMCIVAPGTAYQSAIGTLIMLLWLLIIVRTAPFYHDSEDITSSCSSFVLLLTSLPGLCLFLDDGQDHIFPRSLIGTILVAFNVACLLLHMCFIITAAMQQRQKSWHILVERRKGDSDGSRVRITPLNKPIVPAGEASATSTELWKETEKTSTLKLTF